MPAQVAGSAGWMIHDAATRQPTCQGGPRYQLGPAAARRGSAPATTGPGPGSADEGAAGPGLAGGPGPESRTFDFSSFENNIEISK